MILHAHPLWVIQVDFSIEELVVVIVMEIPLLHNLAYVRGIANYTFQ